MTLDSVLISKKTLSDTLSDTLSYLHSWFIAGDPMIRLGSIGSDEGANCLGVECAPSEFCSKRYYCLFNVSLSDTGLSYFDYLDCLEVYFDITSDGKNDPESTTWRCLISLSSQSYDTLSEPANTEQFSPCGGPIWDLTDTNWVASGVDENLQIALNGGVDSNGVWWEGRRAGMTLSESLGLQFWNNEEKCTLKTPCNPVLDCTKLGSFTAVALGRLHKPMMLPWVFLASSALKNINQQLINQYNELKGAIESLALDTFSIDEFFPTKSQDFDLQNSLAGLSGIFSILGGFVPVPGVGAAISAAGTIASGVGTFLANSAAATSDPLEAQKLFSDKVLTYYRATLSGLDDAVTKLFAGEPIPAPGPESFNITDMTQHGAWVDPNAGANVSDLNTKIRLEILSRSIDSLWKTPPYNKMWVLFTDLQDVDGTKCNSSGKSAPIVL